MRTVPYGDPTDPGYRRLRYIRYADDHLLGFIGPKAEAEEIKDQLAAFLRETLALELNQSKTLITHARTRAARFLGYEITVQHCDRKLTRRRRSANGAIALRVPLDVIKAKCAPYRQHGKPWHRPELQNLDDYDIVRIYGAEYRGIVSYYRLARTSGGSHALRWNAETSMLKTLAAKHQSTVTKMAARYKAKIETSTRAADLLRGPDPPRRQAGPGSTVRRDTPQTRHGRGHRRPRSGPGSPPPQGADPPAPHATVRAMRAARARWLSTRSPSSPASGQARTGPARVGGPHGQEAAQDPRGLRPLPRRHPRNPVTNAA